KCLPRLLVRDKIDITLSMTRFDILQTVPFFRWRPERLGQHFELACLQRRLACLRQKTCAFNADEIAEIEQIETLHRRDANFLLMQVGLTPAGCFSKIDKLTLAHVALRCGST